MKSNDMVILKKVIISKVFIEYNHQSYRFRSCKSIDTKDIKPTQQSEKYLCFLLNAQAFLVKGTNTAWQRETWLATYSAEDWVFWFFVAGKFISSAHKNICLGIFLLIYVCGAWCL